MIRFILILCALTMFSGASAEVPIFLNFEQLNYPESTVLNLEGKEVAMRGFLYRHLDNRWILAADANLKSCCVGSKDKSARQIILTEDKSSTYPDVVLSEVVLIKGNFHITYDNISNKPLYWMDNVVLIQENKNGWIVLSVPFFGLVLFLLWRKYRPGKNLSNL